MQATLLDYSRNKELVLKGWIAVSKYKGTARGILLDYGSEPEFTEILLTYGDSIIPAIQYFRENDVRTLRAMAATGNAIESVKKAVRDFWDRVTGNEQANANPAAIPKPVDLGPKERGWYAVNFIRNEGHDFVGQFAVNKDGKATWNQTDRIVKALTSFFTSGVRNLESKRDLGEDIAITDAFWAGLDVALVALPAKLLASGKAIARSGKELNLATRTRLFAPRLLPKSQMLRDMGKFGVVAGTIYVVATNPSLLNSVFAELAELIGVSPWMMQVAGWSVVIALLIYAFSWLLAPIAKLMLFILRRFERSSKPT